MCKEENYRIKRLVYFSKVVQNFNKIQHLLILLLINKIDFLLTFFQIKNEYSPIEKLGMREYEEKLKTHDAPL